MLHRSVSISPDELYISLEEVRGLRLRAAKDIQAQHKEPGY